MQIVGGVYDIYDVSGGGPGTIFRSLVLIVLTKLVFILILMLLIGIEVGNFWILN
jgi:hypothetical protein